MTNTDKQATLAHELLVGPDWRENHQSYREFAHSPCTTRRTSPELSDALLGRAGPGSGGLLEAFKPGTAPPDNYSVIGVADADGRSIIPQGTTPDAGNIMRPGTGGLY